MTSTLQPTRRSLQARLTLLYAAGIFVAGIVVLVIVVVPLAGIESATSADHPTSTTITSSGNGIGPHELLIGSAIALVVLIPVALTLGWFVAGRFLQPLRAMTAAAKVISAGNLSRRLDLGEPTDELTDLGHTLDDLFARLQAAFDAQRHFVANASHELRTPLAGVRTLLEVTLSNPNANVDTLRSACQEAVALGEHQERLVQALLTLATSERGVTRWDTVDLAHIAQGALASRRDHAIAQGIQLVERLTPAVATGDARLIESLTANLIDNAIRHNHAAGHVEIDTGTSDGQAILTVTNSGPVIADDQLQRLFQPFERLSPDRNGRHDGYGLGLTIVNAVSTAHHATVITRNRPEGGLCITVRFVRTSQPGLGPAHR